MYLGKKKYTLIDVEKGKEINGRVKFVMPAKVTKKNLAWSTACWRGYTMDYHVVQGKLYGVKKQEIWLEKYDREEVGSPKVFIQFTGSCIVARDFIGQYPSIEPQLLDFTEAFELYFEQGRLKEKLSISSVLEEAKVIAEGPEKDLYSAHQTVLKSLKYKYN